QTSTFPLGNFTVVNGVSTVNTPEYGVQSAGKCMIAIPTAKFSFALELRKSHPALRALRFLLGLMRFASLGSDCSGINIKKPRQQVLQGVCFFRIHHITFFLGTDFANIYFRLLPIDHLSKMEGGGSFLAFLAFHR